jgi:hypothetical protein
VGTPSRPRAIFHNTGSANDFAVFVIVVERPIVAGKSIRRINTRPRPLPGERGSMPGGVARYIKRARRPQRSAHDF